MSYDCCTWKDCYEMGAFVWKRMLKPEEKAFLFGKHNTMLQNAHETPKRLKKAWIKATSKAFP